MGGRVRGGGAGIALLVAGLWAASGIALSPAEPEVTAVLETREPGTDALLLDVTGVALRRVHDARLEFPGGAPGPVLGVISPGSTSVRLAVEGPLLPGPYDLVLEHGTETAPLELRLRLSLSGGAPLPGSVQPVAVAAELREDLEDAETLEGEGKPFFQDAGHYEDGSLPEARYSAAEDLVEEGWIQDGRFVTALYSAWEDLEAEGVVSGGLLATARFDAWADLLAEGHRDGDGDLAAAHFSAWDDLVAEGYVLGSGLLHTARFSAWESLRAKGNVDSSEHLGSHLFDAHADLVAEGRVGSGALQAAPGNHGHPGRYLETVGNFNMTGLLSIDMDGATQNTGPLVWGTSSTAGTAGVKFEVTPSTGSSVVAAHVGRGDGSIGLYGEHTATSGAVYGILATNGVAYGRGGGGTSFGDKSMVLGWSSSPDGFGVFAKAYALAIHAHAVANSSPDAARVGIHAVHGGSSGDIALFQAGTTTQARVDRAGKGYFNGGTATSGADFAESVKVAPSPRLPEPGDVVVVDTTATRGFALCTERGSKRIAGVVSTRPGVLAGLHPAASGGPPAGEAPLAIVGIVPVKVTAEGGSLVPGDLLVAASLPGHAMKAPPDPDPGTVLGKSLGWLDGGEGLVEALLTVQ